MDKVPRFKPPRSGLAILVMACLAGGAVLFVNARRSRPADEKFKGRTTHLALPSGSLDIDVPAFLTEVYGAVHIRADAEVIGFEAGNADKGNYIAVALSHADAQPFLGGGFADWVGDAYLDCLATTDPEKSPSWWAIDTSLELQAAPYKLKYVIARNTIPMISRVCLAGTNGVSDINVRIYGGFSGENLVRFGQDLQAMFRSILVREDRARQRLGIRRN